MIESIFSLLSSSEDFLWSYIGFPAIIIFGLYFSIKTRFIQIRKLPSVLRTFLEFTKIKDPKEGGVPPLKVFFACIGGCIGIGNVVGICTAIQLGGPGALFWIWVTAILGMILRYCEVYLGMRYRISDGKGGYNGGPMFYMQRIFKGKWISTLICVLLCVYGVEVYQFSVVTHSISSNWGVNHYAMVAIFLSLVLFAGSGGVRRVGNIASAVIPVFVILYVGMGSWVLIQNITSLPFVFGEVLTYAFSPKAAMGGFIGAGVMQAMSHGVRRGCYTGDVGVGYASVIHSESCTQIPEKQASFAILDIFFDTFVICTTSVMLILTTELWHVPMEASLLVQSALGQYFPYMHYFMPFFLLLLGYSTINSYYCVGFKCAQLISPKYGRAAFYVYSILAFVTFSFIETTQAQSVMAITGCLLLIVNSYGFYKLRNEISFDFDKVDEKAAVAAEPVIVAEAERTTA